jgi:hypothetical protein
MGRRVSRTKTLPRAQATLPRSCVGSAALLSLLTACGADTRDRAEPELLRAMLRWDIAPNLTLSSNLAMCVYFVPEQYADGELCAATRAVRAANWGEAPCFAPGAVTPGGPVALSTGQIGFIKTPSGYETAERWRVVVALTDSNTLATPFWVGTSTTIEARVVPCIYGDVLQEMGVPPGTDCAVAGVARTVTVTATHAACPSS